MNRYIIWICLTVIVSTTLSKKTKSPGARPQRTKSGKSPHVFDSTDLKTEYGANKDYIPQILTGLFYYI